MRNKTRSALREEHFKDPITALDEALKCDFVIEGLGLSALWRERSAWPVLASSKVCEKSRSGRAFGPNLDPMDSVCLRTASTEQNVPGKYGPRGELFFFLIRKEPATVPGSETFSSLLQC